MPKKILTLCMILRSQEILLGMKKRGFGCGFWNGFGGKVMPHETIRAAALREVHEEAGLILQSIHKVGLLYFSFEGDPLLLEGHIFYSDDFCGEPCESEEMRPQWFAVEDLPYSEMWPGDRFWIPLLLQRKKFFGRFHFKGMDLLHYGVEEVESVPDPGELSEGDKYGVAR